MAMNSYRVASNAIMAVMALALVQSTVFAAGPVIPGSVIGPHAYHGITKGHSATRQGWNQTAGVTRSEPPLVSKGVAVDLNTTAYFRTSSARLSRRAKASVDGVMGRVGTAYPGRGMGNVVIVTGIDANGHTDSRGGQRANDRLGLRRAQSVQTYMASRGVNPAAINVQSLGERAPVASNRSSRGRALNRRVEVIIHTLQQR